jgi:hypothetical protein
MARRTGHGIILGVYWLASIALLLFIILTWDHNPLSHREGFPAMPFYGAITWWFFLTIPAIGWTWGYFNDLKD